MQDQQSRERLDPNFYETQLIPILAESSSLAQQRYHSVIFTTRRPRIIFQASSVQTKRTLVQLRSPSTQDIDDEANVEELEDVEELGSPSKITCSIRQLGLKRFADFFVNSAPFDLSPYARESIRSTHLPAPPNPRSGKHPSTLGIVGAFLYMDIGVRICTVFG
jgi:hypothetical protein